MVFDYPAIFNTPLSTETIEFALRREFGERFVKKPVGNRVGFRLRVTQDMPGVAVFPPRVISFIPGDEYSHVRFVAARWDQTDTAVWHGGDPDPLVGAMASGFQKNLNRRPNLESNPVATAAPTSGFEIIDSHIRNFQRRGGFNIAAEVQALRIYAERTDGLVPQTGRQLWARIVTHLKAQPSELILALIFEHTSEPRLSPYLNLEAGSKREFQLIQAAKNVLARMEDLALRPESELWSSLRQRV